MWEHFLDDSLAGKLADAEPEAAAMFGHMLNYQAVRTTSSMPSSPRRLPPASARS